MTLGFSFISNRRAIIKKTFCPFVIFVFLASCAPIFVPQSGAPTETLDAPKFQTPTLHVTGTFTATFTPTNFPAGFTPSPIPVPTLLEQRCSQAPAEQNEFHLPDPSDLKWEMVNDIQSLDGLAGPIQSAYPSPDGRWWMIEMVSRRNYSQFDYSSQTALYVLDSKEDKHWIASTDDKDYLHRFDWFADGKLLWADTGHLYIANADGQAKRTITTPEPVLEVWLDKRTGSRAFVSGQSALWRVDLANGTWDQVNGLEGLGQGDTSPVSRVQANLRVSQDGTFGALLADHQVWKISMLAGEPAQKIGEVEYLDADWRVDAPIPLADSPYWYPGRDAYAPEAFDSPQASLVLIDERDGSLLSLADLVPPDFGYATGMQISPDEKWIAVLNVTSDHSPHSIYLASSNHLDNGKIIPVNSIRDWDITEVISSYPGRVNHPDFAFVITGDFGAHTAALNQLDLVSGKTQVIKKLGPGIYPIVRITWVQNTPIFIDGGVIERITENGILRPIGKLPELRLEDYPQLLIGGPMNQILLTAEVNKSVDNTCQVFYYLYIVSLEHVK